MKSNNIRVWRGISQRVSILLVLLLGLQLSSCAEAGIITNNVNWIGKLDRVSNFQNGYAVVEKNTFCGIVNPDGKFIVYPRMEMDLTSYSYMRPAQDGLFAAFDGLLVSWGYLNENGDVAIAHQFPQCSSFNDGYALASIGEGDTCLVGCIDKTGEFVAPPQYIARSSELSEFSEGLALVEAKNSKYGYIDNTGAEVIPCQYENAYPFENGYALVQIEDNGQWSCIDKTGQVVSTLDWQIIQKPNTVNGQSYMCVKGANGLYGLVDINGDIIIPIKYKNPFFFSDGLARVKLDDLYGYINIKDETIIPFTYTSGGYLSEKLIPVEISQSKWGYIDSSGNVIIAAKFDFAYSFHEGTAWVRNNGKYGLIKNPLQ